MTTRLSAFTKKELVEGLRGMSHTLLAISKNLHNGDSFEDTQDAIEYAIVELQELLSEARQ